MLKIVGLCRFSLVGRGDWRLFRGKTATERQAAIAEQKQALFDDQRLQRRLKSFEEITLASLKDQSDQDFLFFVMASQDLPDPYKSKLQDLCASYQNIRLEIFPEITAKDAQIKMLSAEGLALNQILQFRLDDDDGLSRNYISSLRESISQDWNKEQPFTISGAECLYCDATTVPHKVYQWPIKFLAAGLALFHPHKSIFEFGHFGLEHQFHSVILKNDMALVSHDGSNDTAFSEQIAAKRSMRLLNSEDREQIFKEKFPFYKLKYIADDSSNLPEVYYKDIGDNALEYQKRSSKILFVGFDSLADARNKAAERKPWGYKFAEANGWSYLGAYARKGNWFRSSDFIDSLEEISKTIQGYETVILSGTSMGGYAACAFAPLFPKSIVIAFSPQSTLHPDLTPWDTRYQMARNLDWSGKFADAAQGISAASEAFIFFDPHHEEDRQHTQRLLAAGGRAIHTRRAGHMSAQFLGQIGLLSKSVRRIAQSSFNEAWFYKEYRQSRTTRRYIISLSNELLTHAASERLNRAAKSPIFTHLLEISASFNKRLAMRKLEGFDAIALQKDINASQQWAQLRPKKFVTLFENMQSLNSIKDYGSLHLGLIGKGKLLASSPDYHVWLSNCLSQQKNVKGTLMSLLNAFYIDHSRKPLQERIIRLSNRLGREDIASFIKAFQSHPPAAQTMLVK